MVSHEKNKMWDILENEVPTCVLPTTLRIYLFKGFCNYANL